MAGDWLETARSLLDAPSPAVLTTYRKDGSALVFTRLVSLGRRRVRGRVIAEDDMKLRHLTRDPWCVLVVFEATRPFRGVEVRGRAQLVECDVQPIRAAIAGRYLGAADGERFAAERSRPGVLLRLPADEPRVWDLSAILPA